MELEINNQSYRTGKLNAFQQMHVSRRLAPILIALGKSAKEVLAVPEGAGQDDAAVMAFGPVADALANMPEDDVNYVINTALSVTTRKQGNLYSKVLQSNGNLMFEDMGAAELMQLTVAVIRENIGGFFPQPTGSASTA